MGPSDVSIKMLVAPIHPMDIQMIESASGALPPFLGLEGLGEVSAVGSGVMSLRKGDWVVPQLGFGTSMKLGGKNKIRRFRPGVELSRHAATSTTTMRLIVVIDSCCQLRAAVETMALLHPLPCC